jgi:ribosomal protein S18 acetylase RimI-like enzyme
VRGSVVVRPFDPSDIGGLYALAPVGHRALVDRTVRRHRRNDNLILVALKSGKVVGQVWLETQRRRREGVAILWALRVAPEWRRRGIGHRLIFAAERAAIQLGFARMALGVTDENHELVGMYERRGYRIVGRRSDRERWWTPEGRVESATFVQTSLEKELSRDGESDSGYSLDHR